MAARRAAEPGRDYRCGHAPNAPIEDRTHALATGALGRARQSRLVAKSSDDFDQGLWRCLRRVVCDNRFTSFRVNGGRENSWSTSEHRAHGRLAALAEHTGDFDRHPLGIRGHRCHNRLRGSRRLRPHSCERYAAYGDRGYEYQY